MATAEATLGKHYAKMAKIVDFSPERVKAPFFLRVAALCVDYMVLMTIPVVWIVLWKFIGDGTTATLSLTVWMLAAIAFLINFLLLPLVIGRTTGMLVTGLTIVKTDGSDVDLVHLLLRCTLGYLATVLTLGIGFLIAGINSSGRALHDFIGGTAVVRGRKTLV